MNPLTKIDSKLIDAHQWVLDKTKVEPATAVKWCWRGIAMLTMVKCALIASSGIMDWKSSSLAVLYLLYAAVAYYVYFGINRVVHELSYWYRIGMIIAICLPMTLDASGVASLVGHIIYVMGLYFIVCDKPKPPQRKNQNKLAMQ